MKQDRMNDCQKQLGKVWKICHASLGLRPREAWQIFHTSPRCFWQSVPNYTDQTNQTDQTDETDQTDQIDQTDYTNTDVTDQTGKTDLTNWTDQTDQTDQSDLTDLTDQTDQTDQTNTDLADQKALQSSFKIWDSRQTRQIIRPMQSQLDPLIRPSYIYLDFVRPSYTQLDQTRPS